MKPRTISAGTHRFPFPKGALALALCLGAMVLAWTVGLPAIARTRWFDERRRLHEAWSINPAAMFYTEVERQGATMPATELCGDRLPSPETGRDGAADAPPRAKLRPGATDERAAFEA